MKTVHLLHVPWTGLGLYGGFRGNRWLRNRIKIFKQFVLPSLQAQTNKDFILWCAWRYEERNNPIVQELKEYLEAIPDFKTVFTYAGVCFWDDKYPDDVAKTRLVDAIHVSMGELFNVIGDAEEVLMTIQPSDDCYHKDMVKYTKMFFSNRDDVHVYGYKQGYVMDYVNRRLAEWNPKTTPPFYTVRFPREVFIDPLKHVKYTGPYKSHEYVKDYLPSNYIDLRGFVVGTHGENISTVFDHPYAGQVFSEEATEEILSNFGLEGVEKLKLDKTLNTVIFSKFPYSWKRKLRYLAGEKKWILRPLFAVIYNMLRS